jgi:hypothetical protein
MLIHETLCMMEATGGAAACASIKYMVPTFESYVPADISDEPMPNRKKGQGLGLRTVADMRPVPNKKGQGLRTVFDVIDQQA